MEENLIRANIQRLINEIHIEREERLKSKPTNIRNLWSYNQFVGLLKSNDEYLHEYIKMLYVEYDLPALDFNLITTDVFNVSEDGKSFNFELYVKIKPYIKSYLRDKKLSKI